MLLCVCISVSQRRVVFLDSAEAVAVGLCSDKLAWCFGGTRFGLHRAGAHDADTAAVAHARSTAALLDSPNSQNHDMCHDVRGSSWTTQPARPGGRGTVGLAASAETCVCVVRVWAMGSGSCVEGCPAYVPSWPTRSGRGCGRPAAACFAICGSGCGIPGCPVRVHSPSLALVRSSCPCSPGLCPGQSESCLRLP